MIEALPAELEKQAQELASRMQQRSADVVLQMARQLVMTSDATLFGDTEFLLRDQALKLIGVAYSEYLGQKKTATAAVPSTVRTAKRRPGSTVTKHAE